MSYLGSNYIIGVRFVLLFHRIFGITFGGLVVDSNGKLSTNRFWKVYGYLMIAIHLAFDCYIKYLIAYYEIIGHNSSTFLIYVNSVVYTILDLYITIEKLIILFVMNRYGMEFIELMLNVVSDKFINECGKVKMYTYLFLIWFVHVIGILTVIIIIIKTASIHFAIKFQLCQLTVTCFTFWIVPALTCIVSIYCLDVLDILSSSSDSGSRLSIAVSDTSYDKALCQGKCNLNISG